MVRKQLYIDERHEQALKARAQQLGISEAEIVRDALERALSEPMSAMRSSGAETAKRKLLEELRAELEACAAVAQSEPGYRFNREDAYSGEPRFDRWNASERDGS